MTEEQKVPEEPKEMDKVQQLEEELKEYKDKYLRQLAETENARKRMQKEKQDMVRYAIDNIFTELLPPIDNLENALKHTGAMSEETKRWAQGFQMILSQFKEVLSNNGILAFPSEGKQFDPHLHQAVEIEETEDHPEGIILNEFVKGYKSGERTIRPARVKVAKAPAKQTAEPSEQEHPLEEEKN